MILRILAALVAVALITANCGNDDDNEPEAPVVESVNMDEVPTVTLPTETPTPTASPEATPSSLPELRVWPTSDSAEWPRTPDEAAAAFAQHVAIGDRAAPPRPAVQDGANATAELPRLAEDGAPFGLAATIYLQEVQLGDGSTAWVVSSAQSPEIVVNSPVIGEPLAGGTVVEGEGQGFEGTIVLQIEDQDGLLGLALAQGGALGENLPFETQLPFDERPASGDWAILTGFTTSAVDGSLSSLTMLPVRLVDGS